MKEKSRYALYNEVSNLRKALIKQYPDFKMIQEHNLVECMKRIYPFELELLTSSYVPDHVPTIRDLNLFKTYIWVMREYHELWDL